MTSPRVAAGQRIPFRPASFALLFVFITVVAVLYRADRALVSAEIQRSAAEAARIADNLRVSGQGSLTSIGQSSAGARVLVMRGADTMFTTEKRVVDTIVAGHSTAVLENGTTLRVFVARDEARPQRILLWMVGLFTLFVLAAALAYARRQALRIVERTAELERLSSELLHANHVKNEFLANVSHELRTPLNAIVGFTELLRDGVYGELTERQATPLSRIEASATHLRHLVDQILDLAKIAAGRLEVHREIVDPRPIVLDVANEVESLVDEKALKLSVTIPAPLPRIRTDPTHLRQVLVNLLGNAVKYTPAGRIEVRARHLDPGHRVAVEGDSEWTVQVPDRERHWLGIAVCDTGIGIAPQDHTRIFDEFEQVNAGPRGESMRRGTGLGLPISQRLAKLLGGSITLRSAAGEGSIFTLWLPVDPADLPRPVSPEAAEVVVER